ncbi:MAG: AMP-binding protein [Thermoplasmatales archaeon]|nr:AMP-binding protein [Thermoplasmatales archaeon]
MFNIAHIMDLSVDKWKNKTFLVFNGRKITYKDFGDRVEEWVAFLRSKQINRGDIVAVFSKNRPEMLELWMALSRLGAVYSPYNYNLKSTEIQSLINNSSPSILFTDSSLPEISGTEVINFDTVEIKGSDSRVENTDSEDMCTLLYTSGTEAMPKGVMNTHLNWYSALMSSIYDLEWKNDDVFLLSIPIYHVAGLYTFLGFMNVGGTILIESVPNPSEIISLINEFRVTYLIFPPTVYIALSQIAKEPFSSVKKCISFGAFISESQFDAVSKVFPNVRWRNYYGMTETTPMGTTLQPEDFEKRKESIGKPHINISIKLLRDDGSETKPGEVGEICMKGPSVAKGYFRDDDKTRETFHEGWVHSGDLAKMDDEGFLYFVDRKKDMVRTGGENVSSVEVEREILTYRPVAEAAVVGLPHPYWMEAVTAFVTPKRDQKINETELAEYLKGRMAGYKLPKKIIVLESLPHSASGKLLKRELKKMYADSYTESK